MARGWSNTSFSLNGGCCRRKFCGLDLDPPPGNYHGGVIEHLWCNCHQIGLSISLFGHMKARGRPNTHFDYDLGYLCLQFGGLGLYPPPEDHPGM